MKNLQLLILALLAFSFTLNAQGVSFTFTANYACEHAPLDSILIENLSQNGDTVLYFPDTVLNIIFTGVHMPAAMENEFYVSQNYPNPFLSKTSIDVYIPEQDNFNINVYDIAGRQVASYENKLEKGMHNFIFNGGNSTNYIFTVNSTKYVQKKLMIKLGDDNNHDASITYNGIVPSKKSILKSTRSYFAYEMGDELQYTGYINGNYTEINDTPSTDEDYTFDINDILPTAPTAGTHIAYEEQIEWNWNIVADADGYKINTVNDYSTATDNDTSTTYTQSDINCGTEHTLYVWSYNNCGESTVLSLTETTLNIENPCDGVLPPTGYGIVASGCNCWLDRNLGASQVATSSSYDLDGHGFLFQWGRAEDGHQVRTSPTLATVSSTDYPGHGFFLRANPDTYFDWRSPQNDSLWQGVSGINNPCPSGWRLPTESEWNAERLSWSTNNAAGAFESPLKITLAGYRDASSGTLMDVSDYGRYWTSDVDGTNSRFLSLASGNADIYGFPRAYGASVRCIKD